MIELFAQKSKIIDLAEDVVLAVLSMYPDEGLQNRPVFKDALAHKVLKIDDLKHECHVLNIPWQLFLLQKPKLDIVLNRIEAKRKAKFDLKKIASRTGAKSSVSMRIVDRLISLQEFAKEDGQAANQLCGRLKKVHRDYWSENLSEFLQIEDERLHCGNKQKALDYLIKLAEDKQIYVSRGVLTNKVLPVSNELRSVYKQSSGFVLHDEKVPYIFLPSEINPDETTGRQIYTLLSLLILVGLDEFNVLVSSDFESRVKGDKLTRQIHGAVTEILLPPAVTDGLQGIIITEDLRDELATTYNLTPTAVVITLRNRGLINSDDELNALLNSITPKPPAAGFHPRSPKLTTTIEKFCGTTTNAKIVSDIHSHSLSSVSAQYLLFGHIDKKRYHKFKEAYGL